MNKTILAIGAVASFVCATIFFSSTGCSSTPETTDSTKSVVNTGINSSWAVLPVDIVGETQAIADSFSWRTFIAMNWPADPNSCGADTSKSILSGTGPVVWETYLSSDQIFVGEGNQPVSWCANANKETAMAHLPKKVKALALKTGITRFIHMNAKSVSPHGLDQASGGPLVDQNGRFARYEIHVNMDEYNYITQNSIWSKQGQQNFLATGDSIEFPSGASTYGPDGPIEFKAAWKVLGANDDSTKFYCIRAIVYNDDSGDPSPGPNPVTLGLVGLHISHKTKTQRMWVWSTFEHIDNLTTSFYNPTSNQVPNQPITGSPDELDPATGQPLHLPTQVTRVNPVVQQDDVAALNGYFQGLLSGSVWANYQLIGTQWLQFEDVEPEFLANSVQETYLQGPHPDSVGFNYVPHSTDDYYFHHAEYQPFSPWTSSSCLGCHYTATLAAPGQHNESDFSFLLGNAQ
jgi:hypothetical protein